MRIKLMFFAVLHGLLAFAQSPGAFTATGSMTTARAGHTATLLANGRVLITGGMTGSISLNTATASAELYDPATGTFVPTGSMTTARRGHTATLLPDGWVLIAGGYGSPGTRALQSSELYDPDTGTFTAAGEMLGSGSAGAVLLGNGNVLITGRPTAELYDPVTRVFTVTGAYAGGAPAYPVN